ncbi:MAG: hypothetical protein RLP09_36165 [Sandaracinaceae bacterium]|tara:strand:- start:59 stop:490 length:432 start_codon:yes stop_codon:yes gene_type:complete
MRTWHSQSALILACLIQGCGQSHSCEQSQSGAPGCQPFSHLSDADIDTYCEWQLALHEDPGTHRCETEGGGYGVPLFSLEDCRYLSHWWREWGCERTVVQQERCTQALVEDVCNARSPACQEIPDCHAPRGDGALAVVPDGGD